MELSTLIATFCVAVSFMLPSCVCDQVNAQNPIKRCGNSVVHQTEFTMPLLPRKLKLEGVGKSLSHKYMMPHKKLMEASSDNKQSHEKEENVVHHQATKGTWREWVEAPNKSDYFTTDYAWVRRRRPIHNKHIPFVP